MEREGGDDRGRRHDKKDVGQRRLAPGEFGDQEEPAIPPNQPIPSIPEARPRLPEKVASAMVTGPSIREEHRALCAVFVAEPVRYGRLFLAGDAAHIVPPTGARRLNSAASDIYDLYRAMIDHYKKGDDRGPDGYSDRALARVWKAQRFSWWMTMLLHKFPPNSPYENKLQDTDLASLFSSEKALGSFAENDVGLPF